MYTRCGSTRRPRPPSRTASGGSRGAPSAPCGMSQRRAISGELAGERRKEVWLNIEVDWLYVQLIGVAREQSKRIWTAAVIKAANSKIPCARTLPPAANRTAMLRLALGRVSHRLSDFSEAPSAMCRRGHVILQPSRSHVVPDQRSSPSGPSPDQQPPFKRRSPAASQNYRTSSIYLSSQKN